MPVSVILYCQWFPTSFAIHTIKHIIGTCIALVAFNILFRLTELLVPEDFPWVKVLLHHIETFILLYLILVLAVQILVPIGREVRAVFRGEDNEN